MRSLFYGLLVGVFLVFSYATVQAQGLVLLETSPGLGYGVVEAPDALAQLKHCITQRSGQHREREAQCYKQILGFQRNILQAGDNPDARRPGALPSDCRDLGYWDDPFMSASMKIYQCPPAGSKAQPVQPAVATSSVDEAVVQPAAIPGPVVGPVVAAGSVNEAVVQGDLQALQSRLAAGENPNTRDKFGWTPLMVAAYEGNVDAVRFLLDSGARIGDRMASPLRQTALDMAVKAGKTDVADLLRSRGAK